MLSEEMRLLGIAGSLRHGSYNRALLRAAIESAPDGVVVETAEIGDIPLYNADIDTAEPPESVRLFRERIGNADGLLIASPEYNYSIPGGLKNAIDWASRPATSSVLKRKPVGIMSTATGRFGGVRAQLALRQVFVFTESYVMLKPELILPNAGNIFDENGHLVDDDVRALLAQFMESFSDWTRRMRVD
ncbi:MAG: NAD(P)H-dependent oxidoreductase [Nitrolancea sp.]